MKKKVQGFTLIETMLALTFGLFIINSCIEVYLSTKANYKIQHQLSSMQTNGRLLTYIFQQIKSPDKLRGNDNVLVVERSNKPTEYFVDKNKQAFYIKTQGKPREEIVTHVGAMQVKYGVQCSLGKDICGYLPAAKITDWRLVKSAQISMQLKDQDLQRSWSYYVAT